MHSFQLQGREAFERRAAILALEAEIAGHGVVLAALRLHRLLAKANFNSNQPRVPAGNGIESGRWTDSGGSGGSSTSEGSDAAASSSSKPPPITITLHPRPRDTDDNGGPHLDGEPLDDPPLVPQEQPSTARLRNVIVKAAAKWLLRAVFREATGPIGTFLNILDAAIWIYDAYPISRPISMRPSRWRNSSKLPSSRSEDMISITLWSRGPLPGTDIRVP
jgi:hypothetical protein